MSLEEQTTRFLDALRAWYEASGPASEEEVTVVPIDLTTVHKAYHKLDSELQDQTMVEWSQFLQACQIRPTNREWIRDSIENLAVALGHEVEDPKIVRWVNHIVQTNKDRSEDKDEAQRFLAQVGTLVVSVPALRQAGFVAPRGESLPVLEEDITLLFRCHDALSEADKQAIEREWQELTNAIYSYNEARQGLHSLYDRIAEKLGHAVTEEFEDATTAPMHRIDGKTRLAIVRTDPDSGAATEPGEPRVQVRQSSAARGDIELVALPTLPVAQDEPATAAPVRLPEESREWSKQRIGTIGGMIVAAAAIVVAVHTSTSELEESEVTTIQELQVMAHDVPTCETTTETASDLPATTIPTPKRRKVSKVRFIKDTDSIIIRRKNKPGLMVTVTEVSDNGVPIKKKSLGSERIHSIDARDLEGFGLSLGMTDNSQVAVEVAP